MATTTTTRARRDAGASVFAYAVAAGALLVHAVTTVINDWTRDDLVLDASSGDGRRGVSVPVAEVPDWVPIALRTSDVVEWVAAGVVLLALTACVLGMIRGDVFDRSTARWATTASWASVVLLVLPVVGRLPATNMALQSVTGDWDPQVLDEGWWYLYVAMMTLSFLALVLHRGSQLRADQEGLI